MSDEFQYIHDPETKKVFRFPMRPQVRPKSHGKKVYQYVRTEVDIARANNVLTSNRWKYPASEYPSHTYEDRYDAEEAARYFMRNFSPRREAISKEKFERLSAEYGGR